MKNIRVLVLMILVAQVFTIFAQGRQLHVTRKDMLFAKPPASRVTLANPQQHVVQRNLSQVSYVGAARVASLASSPQISVGGSPYLITSGDFNGDGNRDIAAAISDRRTSGQYLSVLTGRGDTTFNPPITTPATFDKKTFMYAADLNKDGKDDVIMVRSGAVDIFISSGSGLFQSSISYADDVQNPAAVAIADVNGDGTVDLQIADALNGVLDMFLGNGDGTFQSALAFSVPTRSAFAVFADVNKDGKLDLVTDSAVYLRRSAGSFSPAIPLVGAPARSCRLLNDSIAAGDLNGDGYPDIVIAGCDSNQVTVFIANHNGGFQTGYRVWAGFGPQSVRIVDVNGDGIPDIVAFNLYPGDATVLMGDGRGNFRVPRVGYAFGGTMLQPAIIADFNHDGRPDIVGAYWGDGAQLSFLKGVGDGSFVAAQDYFPPQVNDVESSGMTLATADFNKDGRPDMVMGGVFGAGQDGNLGGDNNGVTVFLGTATGRLQQAGNYGTGGALSSVAVGDFNRDGNMDIVAADINTGAVNLFLGNGNGTFQDVQIFPSAPYGASGIVAGDFNRDGSLDVAVVGWPTGVYILLNNGRGQFQSPLYYGLNDDSWIIETADLTNDGNLDLVIPHLVANTFSVLLGNGDGTFQALPDFTNGSVSPGGVVLRDLNNDGKLDMAFTTMWGAAVALGNGDGTFQVPTFYDASHGSQLSSTGNLVLADVNGDGKLDLVFTNTGFGTVDVLPGNGDGTFGALSEFPAGAMAFDLLAVDLNGDGSPDLALASVLYPGVTTLLNNEGATVSLTASPNTASYGQPLALSATITASLQGGSMPTGSVTFLDNGATLGSVPVQANGTASLVISALAAATHGFSAVYSGDSHYFASASAVVKRQVQAPAYSLSVTPATRTIRSGQSTTFTITATSLNGLTGNVTFSCGTPPQGISCRMLQPSAWLLAGRSTTVQVTVTAAPARCSIAHSNSCRPPAFNRVLTVPVCSRGANMVKQVGLAVVIQK